MLKKYSFKWNEKIFIRFLTNKKEMNIRMSIFIHFLFIYSIIRCIHWNTLGMKPEIIRNEHVALIGIGSIKTRKLFDIPITPDVLTGCYVANLAYNQHPNFCC